MEMAEAALVKVKAEVTALEAAQQAALEQAEAAEKARTVAEAAKDEAEANARRCFPEHFLWIMASCDSKSMQAGVRFVAPAQAET